MEMYFKNERIRLNLKQSDVAEKCGVSLKTITNWEKGSNSIPSDKLVVLAEIGFDIQYIIIGKRCSIPTKPTPLDQITKEQLLDTLELVLKNTLKQEAEVKTAIEKIKTL